MTSRNKGGEASNFLTQVHKRGEGAKITNVNEHKHSLLGVK